MLEVRKSKGGSSFETYFAYTNRFLGKMGHGIIGTLAGAFLGSKAEDALKERRHSPQPPQQQQYQGYGGSQYGGSQPSQGGHHHHHHKRDDQNY